MSTLGDALKDAYSVDEHRARDHAMSSHRTITSIRRRRTVRAAGTGTAAAVAVGAVAFGAARLPVFDAAPPALPGVTCSADPFALGNPKAFGAFRYLGRSYIDTEAGTYVFVHADGTHEEMTPDSDTGYRATFDGKREVVWVASMAEQMPRSVMDWVMVDGHSQGMGAPLDPEAWRDDTWEWNVEVPDDVPAGVDLEQLGMLLAFSMFGSGQGLDPSAIPDGATVAIVEIGGGVPYTNPVRPDYPGPAPEEIPDDIAALLLVVTLADGGTYTITAHHDPDATGPLVCATSSPSSSPKVSAPSPRSSDSPSSGGESREPAGFNGPESTVFACGALLPPELEGSLGLDVSWGTGDYPLALAVGGSLPLGEGGVLVKGTLPREKGSNSFAEPGWRTVGEPSGDTLDGVGYYVSVAAVQGGVVVGTPAGDPDVPTDRTASQLNTNGTADVYVSISDVTSRMVPCAGYTEADLDGAQTVVVLGSGLAEDSFEFAWSVVAVPE